MYSQLVVAVVVEALYCRVLDRAVRLADRCLPSNTEKHSLDLAVRPWVVGFRQSVLDAVGLADHVEAHWPGIDGIAVPWPLGEPDAPRHWA